MSCLGATCAETVAKTSQSHAGRHHALVSMVLVDQAYFLTACSIAPPALARSSGTMTG